MNTKLATSRMRTGQWADIIKDCKESGLKVDDYCAQHSLSRNAYFYWLRKVKEAALTQSGFGKYDNRWRLPPAIHLQS